MWELNMHREYACVYRQCYNVLQCLYVVCVSHCVYCVCVACIVCVLRVCVVCMCVGLCVCVCVCVCACVCACVCVQVLCSKNIKIHLHNVYGYKSV